MQKYVKVRSTAREVLPLEIDEYHVILNSGITEIHEPPSDEDMDGGFDGWEIAEQIIYDKDEYINGCCFHNVQYAFVQQGGNGCFGNGVWSCSGDFCKHNLQWTCRT